MQAACHRMRRTSGIVAFASIHVALSLNLPVALLCLQMEFRTKVAVP